MDIKYPSSPDPAHPAYLNFLFINHVLYGWVGMAQGSERMAQGKIN